MPARIVEFIKSFLITPMSDSDKAEFTISINRINVVRAKITAITFIILEVMVLLMHYRMNRENLFNSPYIYYGSMYILNLAAMIAFFAIFTRLEVDVPKHISSIRYTGIFFIVFILMWCAGISLLDQLTNGQVIVYTVAVLSVAITPIYEPGILFLVYLTIHLFFLIALPYFQESKQLIFGNSLNSTTFVIMSWAISFMRYKKQAEEFNNKKIILKKNDELRLINMQLQEANQKLKIMSMTDSLTGVINRLNFETIINDEWSRCKRHSIPLSLIMVDIDFFKQFNDNYGHQAGDNCIKLIADVLKAYAKRSSDKVARYGGDEFVVLLPHTDKESALNLAEQMRKGVEEKSVPHLYSNVSDHVTISLGINTIIPSDESSIHEFISSTDKALYKAKERRNCIYVF
ncbi:MAG TPA: GGDEF domain-containing protein [Clostridiales bacterium]|nr:GGDEF domain-containing protein [Clostridiales bacterium]